MRSTGHEFFMLWLGNGFGCAKLCDVCITCKWFTKPNMKGAFVQILKSHVHAAQSISMEIASLPQKAFEVSSETGFLFVCWLLLCLRCISFSMDKYSHKSRTGRIENRKDRGQEGSRTGRIDRKDRHFAK
ncbi:hypothetical protein BaRGS_00025762 [Batillaria attramentaria]|uniref:Uncharacterized protein n=1 Tax=Batillaria attramentaria TaxID=370345 RepID=A0ABD0K7Q6_9CAEN